MSDSSFLRRLRERKLVQWAIAYLAGAWVVFEVTDAVGGHWGVPDLVYRGLFVLLAIGLGLTLVLAWYHGEKGRQRVSGPELVMIALLLAVAGALVSMLGSEGDAPGVPPTGDEVASDAASESDSGADAAALNRLPGLAVLPLVNRSTAEDDKYFADGIHDDLLTTLQRLPGLRVVSRTSTAAYRDTDKSITTIGRELRVDYVLEGGVQRAGDRVRINLQLIDAGRDLHLWADSYDRVLRPDSLLELQSDVVRNVARELDVVLREEDLQRAARRMTRDPDAYDLFIRGREAWNRGAMEEVAELQGRAIARDSSFVAAYAMEAASQALIYQMSERTPARAEAARRAARRAVELDPDSEDAQLAMGFYFYRVEKNYDEALEWFVRASGSLRGDAEYHAGRGLVERRTGRWRAAAASFETAAELAPGSRIFPREVGRTLLYMRRYDEAERWIRECIAATRAEGACDDVLGLLDWMRSGSPDAWSERGGGYTRWLSRMVLGDYQGALADLERVGDVVEGESTWYPKELLAAWTYDALGDAGRAEEAGEGAARRIERQVEVDPESARYHAALALVYAGLDRRDDAIREATRATRLTPVGRDMLVGPLYLFDLAVVQARVGERADALENLETLLTIPSRYSAAMLRRHYLLRPLWDDPEFLALLEREPGRAF